MKQIVLATIMVAFVLTMPISIQEIAFGQSDSDSDNTGRQILCYGAGLGMIASGIPLPAVIGAGQLAHQNGICP
jgi:hypothetical protein